MTRIKIVFEKLPKVEKKSNENRKFYQSESTKRSAIIFPFVSFCAGGCIVDASAANIVERAARQFRRNRDELFERRAAGRRGNFAIEAKRRL